MQGKAQLFVFLEFLTIFPAHISTNNVLIYFLLTFLLLYFPILPTHLGRLWPLWPSLSSPNNSPLWATKVCAHLSETSRRAAGPGLLGLSNIQSSWKSHLLILHLRKTIKTEKIYKNHSQALTGKGTNTGWVGGTMFESWKTWPFFRGQVRLMTQRSKVISFSLHLREGG